MKKLILLSLFVSTAWLGKAQIKPLPHLTPFIEKNNFNPYTLQDSLRSYKNYKQYMQPFTFNHQPVDKMPVTGKIPPPEFVMNGGNGFDLYKSPLDKMMILEPDAAFHSNMPVLHAQLQITP